MIRPSDVESRARSLYDACPTVKPEWSQLGEATRGVWREMVVAWSGSAERVNAQMADPTKRAESAACRVAAHDGTSSTVLPAEPSAVALERQIGLF